MNKENCALKLVDEIILLRWILVDELAGSTVKTPIQDPGSTDFDIIKLKHFVFIDNNSFIRMFRKFRSTLINLFCR